MSFGECRSELQMSVTRCVAVLAILLSLVSRGAIAANPAMPQIWLSIGGMGNPTPAPSWVTLFFEPNAPWPEFMNHVRVVGILTQVLQRISDENLAKVVARLKEKHVALGVEMLAQAYTLPGVNSPPHCGEGVEGYFAPYETAALAAKLKRAGAVVQYIAMDEPLWFGHYYNEKNACHSSVAEVADRVAANLREYLKVFPDAIIADGEPFPSITDQPTWQKDYQEWLQTFRMKVGKPLSFASVDINWGHTNWPQSLRAFANFARDAHLQIGIIYNAAPPTKSMTNEQWLGNAQQNFVHIEKELGVVPGWAVFASWDRFPGRVLSDQSGLGEDYLIKQYLRLH
jgi:hypothetical protein